MSVDAKLMVVVAALKQSLQTSAGPGSSINSHPNPFFMNVTGEVNLKHMADLVLERLEAHELALKLKIEEAIKKAEAEAAKVVAS